MERLENSNFYNIFKHFKSISSIPRCSGNEEKISKFIYNYGISLGFETKIDNYGNVVIIKPASKGYENHESVVLQSHLDMVCEKTENSVHDFTCDPLKLKVEGDYIYAENTTLGADDGAGVSIAMAILEDKTIESPRIEALFTTTEETTMQGAAGLSADALTGTKLINIDNEDESNIILGCAGGVSSYIDMPLRKINCKNLINIEIKVHGLRGGHSGMTIHEPRLNAIKVLDYLLIKLRAEMEIHLSSINGGTKQNAIPSLAKAIIGIDAENEIKFYEIFNIISEDFKVKNMKTEMDLTFSINKIDEELSYIDSELTTKLLRTLQLFPHGLNTMDTELDVVKSSSNLAILKTKEDKIEIVSSIRSSDYDDMEALKKKIVDLLDDDYFNIVFGSEYPLWSPRYDSKLLSIAKEVYKELKDFDVDVKVIHAGLETGILTKKFPNMEMISIGPTILGAHTPNEKLSIKSTEFVFMYLTQILKNL